MEPIAHNYNSNQSSCYFLDLRNSTRVTRCISLEGGSNQSEIATGRLNHHANVMLSIHEQLIRKLQQRDPGQYHWDNTGDGHLCLMWTPAHAWDTLDNACFIAKYLSTELETYNKGKLKEWAQALNQDSLEIYFGIGLHTGSSLIYETFGKRYAYGVVMNTASRVEGQTKNFTDLDILLTQNFYDYLVKQQKNLAENDKRKTKSTLEKIHCVSKFAMDVKDSRDDGHILYTVRPADYDAFISE